MKSLWWVLGTLLSFSLMAIAVRELSGAIGVFQLLFFRSLIGLVIVLVMIWHAKQARLLSTKRFSTHLLRNVFHFGGQYGWFVGIGLLPLAQVFALEFTVPLWTAVIAWLFLNERLTLRKVSAIVIGLLGVIVILNPSVMRLEAASFIVIAAAMCYSIAHATNKSLASSDAPLTILFYMCLIQFPIGFVLSLAQWQSPTLVQWLWIVAIALTALTAHFCLTKAMQQTEVTTVLILDFLRLPLIAVLGVVLYNEKFELSLLLGGALMLIGNVISLYKRKK